MSEWWTYRPSDFLLFSARTYYRLFELYNADMWPAQVLTVGLGLVLWVALWQGRAWAPRAACVLLGVAWLWIAWAFHWQRFASINWAATLFAAAFAIEGLLWLAWALRCNGDGMTTTQRRRSVGLALLLFAVALQPAVGPVSGRPWPQAEVFGLAPDPTVLGSLGVLLALPARSAGRAWLIWPIPLLWCAIAGMTLATMRAGDAFLLPAAAILALTAALASARIDLTR